MDQIDVPKRIVKDRRIVEEEGGHEELGNVFGGGDARIGIHGAYQWCGWGLVEQRVLLPALADLPDTLCTAFIGRHLRGI